MASPCNTRLENQPDTWSRAQIRRPLAGTTRQEIRLYRKQIRAGLPVLTWRDIRRHRLPFHEAMCCEMEEDGLSESAAYIKHLLKYDEDQRQAAGPETIIWNQPRLKDQFRYLDKLRLGLTETEKANRQDVGAGCKALLQLAIFFMTQNESWWWVAEQLFLQCVNIGSTYRADGGKFEATIKYIYGLFLLDQLHKPEEAYENLQQTRELSLGQTWNAEKELGHAQESIFVETCCLLHKALLEMAEEVRLHSPEQAIRLCNIAIRRAHEAGHPELEAGALLQLGGCQIDAQNPSAAIETLNHYLERVDELQDMTSVCCAHLELAICYKAIGDTESTLNHLENFKTVAESHDLIDKLGSADRYLGEYYLTMGFPDDALSHLISSFSLYHRMDMMDEMEQTRALAGIAMGQTVMPVLADHILMCGEMYNVHSLNILTRWKNFHTPFWDVSYTSLEEEPENSSSMHSFFHAEFEENPSYKSQNY